MSYYSKSDSHIRDKVKVLLVLSNYVTKKRCKCRCIDLAAKIDFVALKAAVDKLEIKKLANVSTSVNNLKTKVDGLVIGELKTSNRLEKN